MAEVVVQRSSIAGALRSTQAAASGGDYFQNDGKVCFHVTNSHATDPRTPTFDSPNTCSFGLSGNAAHDAALAVVALATRVFGPFDPLRFNDANGRVQVSYTNSAADLTVAVHPFVPA